MLLAIGNVGSCADQAFALPVGQQLTAILWQVLRRSPRSEDAQDILVEGQPQLGCFVGENAFELLREFNSDRHVRSPHSATLRGLLLQHTPPTAAVNGRRNHFSSNFSSRQGIFPLNNGTRSTGVSSMASARRGLPVKTKAVQPAQRRANTSPSSL